MPIHFFPRDRLFWFYHCGTLALGTVVVLSRAIPLLGRLAWFEGAIVLAWLAVFTLLVLLFRWQYKRRQGETQPIGRVIVWAIVYSGVAGMLNMALVMSTVLPAFWSVFLARYPRFDLPDALQTIIFTATISEGPICAAVTLAWCFTYVGVTTGRRAHNADLNNLRLQNSLKEAQLASLSSQLNPHFLFNSLNNIRFMMYEDTRRADAMMVAFSDILRYSLESGKQAKVPLSDELAIIRKYIGVVAAQFESRLQVDINVAACLERALVPPMVLQLLVENAIKHGLEQLRHGGMVSLEGTLSGQRISLVLANNAPPPGTGSRPGLGIGLANVRHRLALLYSGAAALEVDHTDTRFTVRLILPMEVRA